MIYLKKPKGFNSKFNIVSCLCECEGKMLLLHRQDHKPQGGEWGMPAGKMDESDKSPESAIIRELFEETGIEINSDSLNYFKKIFTRYPGYDFIFHMFQVSFKTKPEVKINLGEHKSFVWVTPQEALSMNLMQDLDKCIKMLYYS